MGDPVTKSTILRFLQFIGIADPRITQEDETVDSGYWLLMIVPEGFEVKFSGARVVTITVDKECKTINVYSGIVLRQMLKDSTNLIQTWKDSNKTSFIQQK